MRGMGMAAVHYRGKKEKMLLFSGCIRKRNDLVLSTQHQQRVVHSYNW